MPSINLNEAEMLTGEKTNGIKTLPHSDLEQTEILQLNNLLREM